MSLITDEEDDAALLQAEDEAIARAARVEQAVEHIPTGANLARLIEDLSRGGAQEVDQAVRNREG